MLAGALYRARQAVVMARLLTAAAGYWAGVASQTPMAPPAVICQAVHNGARITAEGSLALLMLDQGQELLYGKYTKKLEGLVYCIEVATERILTLT